jgi:hypothetical protein
MKNWIIIVITLLLTALYVMSVRQALGGLRYLHRVEPRMMVPAEAQMAAVLKITHLLYLLEDSRWCGISIFVLFRL